MEKDITTQQNTTSSKTINVKTMVNSEQYSGTQNLTKLESLAEANPNDVTAQINAGISSYSNANYTKAIEYYNNVIKIDPNNGVAFNNLGNVYFRGLSKPNIALTYYEKATQVEPSYNYGWLNLALCQQKLGNKAEAITAIDQGLKVLDANDIIVASLKELQGQIK
ncbi:MAG: tetratricopeptide repeat protein [Desulfosporosinus sp.]|nr:tetratricopeptide repeat protein [Desulfosporosinus sp.]